MATCVHHQQWLEVQSRCGLEVLTESQVSVLTADVAIKVCVHRQCVYTGCKCLNVWHVCMCACVCQVCACLWCGVQQICVFLGLDHPDVPSCWFRQESVFVLTESHFNSVLGNKGGKDGSADKMLSSHIKSQRCSTTQEQFRKIHVRVQSKGGCGQCISYSHYHILLPYFSTIQFPETGPGWYCNLSYKSTSVRRSHL